MLNHSLVPNLADYLGVSNFEEFVFEISFSCGYCSIFGRFLSCRETVEMTLLVKMVGYGFCGHFDYLLIVRRFAPKSYPISTTQQLLLNLSVASSSCLVFQLGNSLLLNLLFCVEAHFNPIFDLFDAQPSKIEHLKLFLMRSHVIRLKFLLKVILHFFFEDSVENVHERRAVVGVIHDLLLERIHAFIQIKNIQSLILLFPLLPPLLLHPGNHVFLSLKLLFQLFGRKLNL